MLTYYSKSVYTQKIVIACNSSLSKKSQTIPYLFENKSGEILLFSTLTAMKQYVFHHLIQINKRFGNWSNCESFFFSCWNTTKVILSESQWRLESIAGRHKSGCSEINEIRTVKAILKFHDLKLIHNWILKKYNVVIYKIYTDSSIFKVYPKVVKLR